MAQYLTGLVASITSTGISAPSFDTILAGVQGMFQSIYGADIYLGNDSQDGQLCGFLANAINDMNNALISTYNSFSPATAQGTALSSNVKINGLQREGSTNSTVVLTIGGSPGYTITNGQATDANNTYNWALPASVIIPSSGSIAVTATCLTAGAISVAAGTITKIATPTSGWTSVTNAQASTPGAATEDDATLRARQSISTAKPALTIAQAIEAAIANLSGVTDSYLYENDTSATDANGVPAGAICAVVAGGNAQEIAQTVFDYKAPGTPTYGNTSETIYDSNNAPHVTQWSNPTTATITLAITIKGGANYVSSTTTLIQQAAAAYVNSIKLSPASVISWARALAAAVAIGGNSLSSSYDVTALTLAKNGGTAAASDITLAFDEIAYCDASTDVTVTVN